MDILIQKQMELEQLYSKHNTNRRIRDEFIQTEVFGPIMEAAGIPEDFGYDVLVQMALHKRCDLPTLVGILRHHFDVEKNSCQLTADMILRCAHADLLDWNDELFQFIVIYTITDDIQEEIDRFQYPLPMVVAPRRISTNKDTGYLVNGRGSVILKDNHHEDDVCLDHLNRLNAIPFSIDLETATMVKNQWRNLDKPKQGESNEEFMERVRAFEKYDRTAKDVIDRVTEYGNEFYLTHAYDKRGRTYCRGYHVNYQGNEWNKAAVQLAEELWEICE